MSGVHGLAGLGAMLWAGLHPATGHPPKPAHPHAQVRKDVQARPAILPKLRPKAPSDTPAVEPAPSSEPSPSIVALPRPLPQGVRGGSGVATADLHDERRDFHGTVMALSLGTEGSPLPRPRPGQQSKPLDDPFVAYGREKAAAPDMVTAFLPPPVAQHISPDDDAACRARLEGLGVTYQTEDGLQFASAGCTVVGPLRVTAIGSGMTISPPPTLNCRTTEALAKWMRDVVAPAAEKRFGARPSGIAQASGFVCRPRNNVAGEVLSEHATGNAVDVSAIVIAGRKPLDIRERGDDEADDRDFQAEIRQGACGLFTTVLGPGTNPAHATHFHLDLAQRRGGFRLCE